MIDDLAAHRWDKANSAADIKPADALRKCLSRIDAEDTRSVYIICVDSSGDQWSYAGGPDVGTFRKAWSALQRQAFRVVEMMVDGRG